jgi:hypothetical protein
MEIRNLVGDVVAFLYNKSVGFLPSRLVRHLFLRAWLGALGEGSGVQSGNRFLNGRKVFLGKRNVVNYGCLLDGRKFKIQTGCDVSITPFLPSPIPSTAPSSAPTQKQINPLSPLSDPFNGALKRPNSSNPLSPLSDPFNGALKRPNSKANQPPFSPLRSLQRRPQAPQLKSKFLAADTIRFVTFCWKLPTDLLGMPALVKSVVCASKDTNTHSSSRTKA